MPIDGYVATIEGDQADGWEITNRHEPAPTVQDDIKAIAPTEDDVTVKSIVVAIAASAVAALALTLAHGRKE